MLGSGAHAHPERIAARRNADRRDRRSRRGELAIELVSGQRPGATVEWVGEGEAGVRFKQPIDVLALINRTLISQPAERRSMPRVELRCGVRVKWGGSRLRRGPAQYLGARNAGRGEELPPKGTYVAIWIDGLNVPAGEVMWRKDDVAGIQLSEELCWTSLMPWIRKVSSGGMTR